MVDTRTGKPSRYDRTDFVVNKAIGGAYNTLIKLGFIKN
jgi:hypothetical protein